MKFADFIEAVKGVYPEARFPKMDTDGFTVNIHVDLCKPGFDESHPAGNMIWLEYMGSNELINETIPATDTMAHCENISLCDLSQHLQNRKNDGYTHTRTIITLVEKQ